MKFALLLTACVSVCTAFSGRVHMEPRVSTHLESASVSSWQRVEQPDPAASMSLTVAIRVDQASIDKLEKTFYAVSTPSDPMYGQHLSVEEITQLLAVPAARVDTVRKFFMQAGATSAEVNPNQDMIAVKMPVAAVEAALNTTIFTFAHKDQPSVQLLRAATAYSLPARIAAEVTMVGELLQFPYLSSPALRNLPGEGSAEWDNTCDKSACNNKVTPSVLLDRYNVEETTAPVAGNSMAVAEFQGQYFSPADNVDFTTNCHRDVAVDDIVGGNTPNRPGVEASLDIEYIRAISPEVPLTVIYAAKYSLLDWANQITANESSPLVHSVSYGNDEEQQSSTEYMLTCNTAFMKAGARGLSILFASGDQGVCGRSGCGVISKRFSPDFPGGSPYITVVGGTDFNEKGVVGDEKVWTLGGGGFSDTFDIPDYQATAVSAYKSNPDADLPAQSLWNNTGRGYPDLAALGGQVNPYCVVSSGSWEGVAGTSASCPVAAGVFAKLNGVRLAAGKAPLGFLNPFIYKNCASFQDVTLGENNGAALEKRGFKAVAGWDASSGCGTPDFETLSKLV